MVEASDDFGDVKHRSEAAKTWERPRKPSVSRALTGERPNRRPNCVLHGVNTYHKGACTDGSLRAAYSLCYRSIGVSSCGFFSFKEAAPAHLPLSC
jgi:hypothetical protein